MRQFDYSSATSIDKTIQLLGQASGVKALAGGTDLIPLMKSGIASPTQIVDIKRLEAIPRGISNFDDSTRIGARTTLTEIELNEALLTRHPAIVEAASLAATPQLRNMATIGGNLLQRPRCWYYRHANFDCWLKGGDECFARDGQNQLHAIFGDSPCVATHPSDLAAALLALDASVQLQGSQGERTLSLADFFTLPQEAHRSETNIAPDELLLNVTIPYQPQNGRSVYLKAMDRKVWAFALVGVAAYVQMDGDQIADLRIVLNGVSPIPWRLTTAEQTLIGQKLDDTLISNAIEDAFKNSHPLEHNGYKIPLVQSLIRRALLTLAPSESS